MKIGKGIVILLIIAAPLLGYLSLQGVSKENPPAATDQSRILNIGEYRDYIVGAAYRTPGLVATDAIYSSLATTKYVSYVDERNFDLTMEFVKGLLEKESFSVNGRILEGTLRDDIYFHNGEKLTVEDIAFSSEYFYTGRLMGGVSIPEIEDLGGNRIRITRPVDSSWKVLYFPIFNKRYEERYLEKGGVYIPMGTGPYKVVSLDKVTGEMRLKRFEKYFETRRPYFDEIVQKLYDSSTAFAVAFLEGELDYARELTSLEIQIVSEKEGFHLDAVTVPCPQAMLIYPENAGADARVRRALSLLIDREKIVNDPFVAPFAGLPTDTPYRIKSEDGAGPYVRDDYKMYDPELAFRKLKEAGWRRENGRLRNNKGEPLLINARIEEGYFESSLHAYRMVLSQWAEAGAQIERFSQERGDAEITENAVNVAFLPLSCMLDSTSKVGIQRSYCGGAKKVLGWGVCDDEEMRPLIKQLMADRGEGMEALMELFAKKLKEGSWITLLYYPKETLATSWKFSNDARKALLNSPWSLHRLYIGAEGTKER